MADKMTLQKEFERLYKGVDKLFRPVYDEQQEKFMEAIADLQKKGVSIIDVNNVTQRAFAQPNNYSDNPEMRVIIVGGDGKGLKYYRLEHSRDADLDLSDGESKLSQEEFEKLCIPTYSQPNPLMDPKDTKLDYNPTEEEVKGSKAGPSKKMSVKKDEKPLGLKPDHPEVKSKTVEYGDTSSPKNKIKDDAGLTEGEIKHNAKGKELEKKLKAYDRGPEGMNTIRWAAITDTPFQNLLINVLAGSAIVGYLRRALKAVGYNAKYETHTTGPGDHTYYFTINKPSIEEGFVGKIKEAVEDIGPMEDEDLSGGYRGYQIKRHAPGDGDGYYIEDKNGTPVKDAENIISKNVAKLWVDELVK